MTFEPGQHVEVEHTFPAVIVRRDGEEFYLVTSILPEHMLNSTDARHPEFADHAAAPGARRDRVAEAVEELLSGDWERTARGNFAFVPVRLLDNVRYALAALDQPAGKGTEEGESCPDCKGSGGGLTLHSGETWPCRRCGGTGIARAAGITGGSLSPDDDGDGEHHDYDDDDPDYQEQVHDDGTISYPVAIAPG